MACPPTIAAGCTKTTVVVDKPIQNNYNHHQRSAHWGETPIIMSVVGNNRVGIPIVVLHDAEGAVVEIETKTGELIRGLLFEAEDQMNLYIKNAIIRDTNGVKRKSPQVYVRGTEIVFIVLPDMLKHAPMFNR